MPIESHRGIHHSFIRSGGVIAAINAMPQSMSRFLSGQKKVLRLPEAGGLRGQPELVWISA
jgi:hypothetical protein